MPSKAFSQANLLGTDNTLQATSLSADIPITELYANIDELPASGTLGEQAFVQSTNRLYIWNGSGWYNIALINTTPTWDSGGQPAASYELDADSPQGSVIVTLSASDPEGIPITYSYIQSGQMDSMATISQDSSVFTITPKTISEVGEGVSLTGNITFRASDGINILPQVSSFTLNFISIIENSKYTTLLATVESASDNNNITDSSTNNHSITVSGDAHAGTFSPYRSGGYSTYFDGAGDYLNAPASATFEFGTGDFSMELFFHRTTSGSSDTLLQYGNASVSGYQQISWALYISSSNYLSFEISDGTPGGAGILLLVSSVLFPTNSWVHISVVRDGNNFTLYQNGNSVATITDNRSVYVSPTPLLWIGRNHDAGTSDAAGFFSNVRIVKGTAVYTSNFTPPSEPLTAITGTSLLTCHLPYIADGSTNDHSITVNGNTYTKPFSPYDYNEYSAADHGGSVYFDGTTDYLLINSPPTLGANDWTFETWYYSASVPLVDYNVLLSQGPGNNTIVSNFSVSSTGEIWIQTYTTTNVVLYNTAAGTIKGGMWNHIVLTHDYDGSNGGTYKIYANGNQVGNVSYTSGYYWNSGGISGTPLAMAQYRYNTQANSACYFSDWKISNSVTYSSNFTPPTAPLSSTGAELHIKGTDASIIDKSQSTNLKLVGNTTGSTTQAKFSNTKSMYFDGSGDYALISKDTANINTLDKDFTIEFWLYDSSPTTWKYIAVKADNTGNTSASEISFGTGQFTAQTDGKLYYTNTLGAYLAYTNSALSANTWYHIAVVRNNNVFTMYLDGVAQTATTTNSGSVAVINEDLVLGGHQYQVSTLSNLNGYIQDFRITKGLARYTANFTPPTAPLKG